MHQYDPKKVHAIYGGAIITGYADGSFLRIEYNEDFFNLLVGADGEATRSKSNNRSAIITMTLMPGSSGNAILGAAAKADDAAGAGVLPLVITDLSTGTTFAAESAWVKKDPGYDFQKEAQAKEWTLETDNLTSIHGFSV